MPVIDSSSGPSAMPSPINVSCVPIALPRAWAGAMVTIQVSQVTQRTISPNPASRLRTKKTAMSSANAIAAITAVEPNALKPRLADGPIACRSAGTNRDAARIASQGTVANKPIAAGSIPLSANVKATSGGRAPIWTV